MAPDGVCLTVEVLIPIVAHIIIVFVAQIITVAAQIIIIVFGHQGDGIRRIDVVVQSGQTQRREYDDC